MLCLQCEQTKQEEGQLPGCMTAKGMCGKEANTSDLQDILIYQLIGIAELEQQAREVGIDVEETDKFIKSSLFTTLTNVNFSVTRFQELINQAFLIRNALIDNLKNKQGESFSCPQGPASFIPAEDLNILLAQASVASMLAHESKIGKDANGLWLLKLYGLKGVGAYAHHAQTLGYREDAIDGFRQFI